MPHLSQPPGRFQGWLVPLPDSPQFIPALPRRTSRPLRQRGSLFISGGCQTLIPLPQCGRRLASHRMETAAVIQVPLSARKKTIDPSRLSRPRCRRRPRSSAPPFPLERVRRVLYLYEANLPTRGCKNSSPSPLHPLRHLMLFVVCFPPHPTQPPFLFANCLTH